MPGMRLRDRTRAKHPPRQHSGTEGRSFYTLLTPPGEQVRFNKDRLASAFPGIDLMFFSDRTPVDWKLNVGALTKN